MAKRTAERPRPIDGRQTYVFKIVPRRKPSVSRTIEVRANQTLADVHDAIQRAFELDDDHLWAFYMTNKAYDRRDAYTCSVQHAWERDAYRAYVGSLRLSPGKKFLYLFDFGDDLKHEIEVVGTGTVTAGQSYPRLVESIGKAPPQYGYEEDEGEDDEVGDELILADDLAPLAGELRAAGEASDTRMDEERERTPEELAADVERLRRTLRALEGRDDQLVAFDEHAALGGFLVDVAVDLRAAGAADDAIALTKDFDERFGARLSSVALAHARIVALTRSEAARPLLDALLSRADVQGDLDALDDVAELLQRIGDLARSDALTRRILDESDDDLLLGCARERLIELRRAQGDDEGAAKLEEGRPFDLEDDGAAAPPAAPVDTEAMIERALQMLPPEHRASMRQELQAMASGGPSPARPAEPRRADPVAVGAKIGRNDPCTCGSGKKYKKCCAA